MDCWCLGLCQGSTRKGVRCRPAALGGGEVEDLEGGAEVLRLTVERPFLAAGAARVRAEVGRVRAGLGLRQRGWSPGAA